MLTYLLRIFKSMTAWLARFSAGTLWAAGCLLIGGIAGVVSATVALNSIGLSDARLSSWRSWSLEDDSLARPYALGHFLAQGQLPPSNASQQFVRMVDDTGRGLGGTCVIVIKGTLPAARWWTIAATSVNGSIANPRSVLSAAHAMREANGQLIVHISRDPSPGNWLMPPGNGAYVISLTLHDPVADVDGKQLPSVVQEGC